MNGTLTVTASPINGTAKFSWQTDDYPEPYTLTIEPTEDGLGWAIEDSGDADSIVVQTYLGAWTQACTLMGETLAESFDETD